MTLDPVGFPPIRRRVWVIFCTHGSVGGTNFVPSGFAGLGLILLNLDPVPVGSGLKLKHANNSCIMCVGHQNWVNMHVMNYKYSIKSQILC
jgi:hypothetical protein